MWVRHATAAIAGVSGVLALGAASAARADEAPKCSGEPVTLSFEDVRGDSIVGTDGPDVIQGGPAGERIDGRGGIDLICGGKGADKIGGGPGRDELRGEEDPDTFGFNGRDANPTNDVVIGGDGPFDFVTYILSPVRVEVDMITGNVRSGAGDTGRLYGTEKLAGSQFNDLLVADSDARIIDGLDGDDVVEIGRARDMHGAGRAVGGTGLDYLAFATSNGRVSVKTSRTDRAGGEAEVDRGRKSDFYEFEGVIGSRFDDVLLGSNDPALADFLDGGPGDDLIKGFAGDDLLEGGRGNDTIHPGAGDDTVNGGPSSAVTSVQKFGDLVSYALETYTDPDTTDFDFGLDISLTTNMFGTPPHAQGPYYAPGGTEFGDPGFDVLIGIESARGLKTGGEYPFNDITGNDGPNVLIGGERADTIEGNDGPDFLLGLGGYELLDGGAGDDYIDAGGGGQIEGGEGFDTCVGTGRNLMDDCEKLEPVGDGEGG